MRGRSTGLASSGAGRDAAKRRPNAFPALAKQMELLFGFRGAGPRKGHRGTGRRRGGPAGQGQTRTPEHG